MENIVYEKPSDCMVTVQEQSVKRIRDAAIEKHLTTNRLASRAGVDRNVVEGLYYGKHRIRLSHLEAVCNAVFGSNSTYSLQEGSFE